MATKRYTAIIAILVGMAGLVISVYAIIGLLAMLYNYNHKLFEYTALLLGGLSLASLASKLLEESERGEQKWY